MDHSIISDEINAGIPWYTTRCSVCTTNVYTLKDSSLVSLNVNKFILYHLLKNTL